MSCVFQNIAQMQNRYPDNAWLEIIGSCDTQLFLGCTDELTAKFISDRTGEVTIGVESMAKEMRSIRFSNYTPSHRETSSIGKRKLLTPDEVLRLPREEALVIFRGQKVLKVKKFDYTKHPESRKIRNSNARDYIPNWHTNVRKGSLVTAPVYDGAHDSSDLFETSYDSDDATVDKPMYVVKAKRRTRQEDVTTVAPTKRTKKTDVASHDAKPENPNMGFLFCDEVNASDAAATNESPMVIDETIPDESLRLYGAIDIEDLLSDL